MGARPTQGHGTLPRPTECVICD
jgi:putative transposase